MPNHIGHWIFVDSGSTEVKTNDSNKDLGCIVRWRTSCDRCNSGNQGSRDMSETRALGCIQEICVYIYMIFTDICVYIYIHLHIISMYPLSLGTDSPKVMFRNEVVAGQTSGGSKSIKRKSRIGMFCYKQYSQGNFPYFLDQYYDQQGLHTLCHRSQIFLDPDWINSAQTQVGFDLGCPFWHIGLAGIRLYIYGEILGKWQTKCNWIVYFLKFGWFFHDKMVAPYHHRRMIYCSAYSHGSVKTLTFARKGNIIVLVWDLLFMILGGGAC